MDYLGVCTIQEYVLSGSMYYPGVCIYYPGVCMYNPGVCIYVLSMQEYDIVRLYCISQVLINQVPLYGEL